MDKFQETRPCESLSLNPLREVKGRRQGDVLSIPMRKRPLSCDSFFDSGAKTLQTLFAILSQLTVLPVLCLEQDADRAPMSTFPKATVRRSTVANVPGRSAWIANRDERKVWFAKYGIAFMKDGVARKRIVIYAKAGKRFFAVAAQYLLFGLLCASVTHGQKLPIHPSAIKPAKPIPGNPSGNQPAQESAPAAPQPPQDPLGRSTLYGCVLGFLRAVANNNLAVASQYLDTKLPEDQAEQLAKQLKAVLGASLSTSIEGISRGEAGNLNDNLRMTREKIGVVRTSSGDLDILLDHVQRRQEPSIWLFSADTLAQIPSFYAHLETRDSSRFLPAAGRRIELFGLPLWRWVYILLAIALAVVLSTVVTRLLLLIFGLTFHESQLLSRKEILGLIRQPIRILLLSLALWIAASLSLSVLARHRWALTAQLLAVLGFGWLLVRLVDLGARAGTRQSIALGVQDKVAVITLVQRLFKVLTGFAVLLILLRQAGVNVSAMLAGLGIGGIALALAAQNTLQDLFGSISIISRETIRVGDYCRLAGQIGTVEDIGLASTRLRTLDRTVISIPNSKIA